MVPAFGVRWTVVPEFPADPLRNYLKTERTALGRGESPFCERGDLEKVSF